MARSWPAGCGPQSAPRCRRRPERVMAAVERLARNDDDGMRTSLGEVGKVDLTGLHQGALLARSPALRRATARIALCRLSSSTISRTASYSASGRSTYASLERGSTRRGGPPCISSSACCCCSVKRMGMGHYRSIQEEGDLDLGSRRPIDRVRKQAHRGVLPT